MRDLPLYDKDWVRKHFHVKMTLPWPLNLSFDGILTEDILKHSDIEFVCENLKLCFYIKGSRTNWDIIYLVKDELTNEMFKVYLPSNIKMNTIYTQIINYVCEHCIDIYCYDMDGSIDEFIGGPLTSFKINKIHINSSNLSDIIMDRKELTNKKHSVMKIKHMTTHEVRKNAISRLLNVPLSTVSSQLATDVKKYIKYNEDEQESCVLYEKLNDYLFKANNSTIIYTDKIENMINEINNVMIDTCVNELEDSIDKIYFKYAILGRHTSFSGGVNVKIINDTITIELSMLSDRNNNISFIKNNALFIKDILKRILETNKRTRDYVNYLYLYNTFLTFDGIFTANFHIKKDIEKILDDSNNEG